MPFFSPFGCPIALLTVDSLTMGPGHCCSPQVAQDGDSRTAHLPLVFSRGEDLLDASIINLSSANNYS